ncbi:hypothetical protein [Methylobacterium nigriterrae]|uniref:hypothetical protein n=1 Tax=Methylobacterium nigriterrae TaxID=3127512 RepID=UPI003013DFA5
MDAAQARLFPAPSKKFPRNPFCHAPNQKTRHSTRVLTQLDWRILAGTCCKPYLRPSTIDTADREEDARRFNAQIEHLTQRGDLAERALKVSERLSAERQRLFGTERERNEALSRALKAALQEAEAQRARADQAAAENSRYRNAVAGEQENAGSLADTLAKVRAEIDALKGGLTRDAIQSNLEAGPRARVANVPLAERSLAPGD